LFVPIECNEKRDPRRGKIARLIGWTWHTLEVVLLLDGVRVERALGGVDELIGETIGDGLKVVESGFAGRSVRW
jgi:hypothetical protein